MSNSSRTVSNCYFSCCEKCDTISASSQLMFLLLFIFKSFLVAQSSCYKNSILGFALLEATKLLLFSN